MKKLNLTLIAAITTIASIAQDKKDLGISFSTGRFTSPYYEKDEAGTYFNLDFDYYLTPRQVLSANFNSGSHDYYEDVLSNTGIPLYENTNAEAEYRTFSILYKHKLPIVKGLFAGIGAGAGIMTHIRNYPYTETNFATSYRESSWTDLVFPVRLELGYKLSQHFQVGLMAGFFIHPDYPVLGHHGGPRLNYIIK